MREANALIAGKTTRNGRRRTRTDVRNLRLGWGVSISLSRYAFTHFVETASTLFTDVSQTAKIGSLVDVNESEDPEGLRVFYYLVQDLKALVFSLISLHFKVCIK